MCTKRKDGHDAHLTAKWGDIQGGVRVEQNLEAQGKLSGRNSGGGE